MGFRFIHFAIVGCFVPSNASSAAFVPSLVSKTRKATLLHGDGNPPPFGSWIPATGPTPSPARGNGDGNPPPFGSWSTPASVQPADTGPSPVSSSTVDAATRSAAAMTTASSAVVGEDPIATLAMSQTLTLRTIEAAIPDLESKPSLSWSGEPIGSGVCTLDARDAAGPSNVAWMASVHIHGKLCSLTIFNGPLTDVPHLLSRCYFDQQRNELEVALDFRPRAYGAYETVDSEGKYPGPETLGRKAFEYSGARMDFFNKFGTEEFRTKLNELTKALQGVQKVQPSELDLKTGGPLAIALKMPASSQNVQIVAQLRQLAANAWLTWATDRSGKNNHRPGAPINTQYVYDAKFRQNSYLALRDYYSQVIGSSADGSKLAAAESGPLDEAYVGGGS